MDGLNTPGLLWVRPEDGKLFDALVAAVFNGHCCVFVGAGLSIPARYPGWAEVLELLSKEAGVEYDWPAGELAPEEYLRRAGECACRLSKDKYFAFLENTFSPTGRSMFRDIHTYLMRTPFDAVITTNYDACLENAAEDLDPNRRVHVFPDIDVSSFGNGDIFHIHGKAFDEKGTSLVGSIVLTEGDYRFAYDGDASVQALVHTAYRHRTILFIGYRLKDPPLTRILNAAHQQYRNAQDEVVARRLGEMPPKRHYALMAIDGEKLDQAEEQRLAEWGVSVLWYRPGGEDHPELTRIVKDLQDRTRRAAPLQTPRVTWGSVVPRGAGDQ